MYRIRGECLFILTLAKAPPSGLLWLYCRTFLFHRVRPDTGRNQPRSLLGVALLLYRRDCGRELDAVLVAIGDGRPKLFTLASVEDQPPRCDCIYHSGADCRADQRNVIGSETPCGNCRSRSHQQAAVQKISSEKSHVARIRESTHSANPPWLYHGPNKKGCY